MGGLNRARYVRHRGNSRSPVGREPYGDGALVVVRGRESRPHGEGGQAVGRPGRGGTRHARRRDDPGHAGLPPLRGTPEVIIERLKLTQDAGIERMCGAFGFPGLPQWQVLRSSELFCTEVLPHFREVEAPVVG